MDPIVRIYTTETQARDAARALSEAGFADAAILLLTPVRGSAGLGGGEGADSPGLPGFTPPADAPVEGGTAVREAVAAGRLPSGLDQFYTRNLQEGRSIVAVQAPFGAGATATNVLEDHQPVDESVMPAVTKRNPSPFSDFLGWPALTRPRYRPFLPLDELSPSQFSTPGLQSDNPTPLSSMLRMKTISEQKRPWTKSFGFSMLSQKAAPFSSMFGMKTLSKNQRSGERSFGFKLLSNEPTPFSKVIGFPILSRKRKND